MVCSKQAFHHCWSSVPYRNPSLVMFCFFLCSQLLPSTLPTERVYYCTYCGQRGGIVIEATVLSQVACNYTSSMWLFCHFTLLLFTAWSVLSSVSQSFILLCVHLTGHFRCKRCKKTPYCSVVCQTEDWMAHRRMCKPTDPEPVK